MISHTHAVVFIFVHLVCRKLDVPVFHAEIGVSNEHENDFCCYFFSFGKLTFPSTLSACYMGVLFHVVGEFYASCAFEIATEFF